MRRHLVFCLILLCISLSCSHGSDHVCGHCMIHWSALTLLLVACPQDEGVRLRKVAMSDTTSFTPATTHTVSMEPTANALPPIVYLVAAVILGLILGKFIL